MIRITLLVSVFASAFVGQAVAQPKIEEQDGLGIKLEELLSDKGTFRLEFGTTFSASRREGVSALYQTIQTGTGQFITVPVDVGSAPKAAQPVTIASARGMTQTEMHETEGAWGPASIFGGAIGGGGYLLTTPRSNWSWGGFGGNVALGAVTAGGSALGLRGASMAAGRWTSSRGIGIQGSGWRAAYHGPHHDFGVIGRQPHLQLNTWTPGVRNSGSTWRLPW